MKNLLIFYFVFCSSFSFASEIEVIDFVITDETNISSFVPKEKVWVIDNENNQFEIDQFELYDSSFIKFLNDKTHKYSPYKFYIQKFYIFNQTNKTKTITVRNMRRQLIESRFLFLKENSQQILRHENTINHNELVSKNPFKTNSLISYDSKTTIDINPNERITVFNKFKTPNRSFLPESVPSYRIDQTFNYIDHRRLGVWLEGIFLGSVFALFVFSWFNYTQHKEKYNLYYSLWISFAITHLMTIYYHDGSGIFEFFIDLSNYTLLFGGTNNTWVFITMLSGFAQAMIMVIFIRKFIDLKKYYPKLFRVTNIYLFLDCNYLFLALFINHPLEFNYFWLPRATLSIGILTMLLVVILGRYLSGMDAAKYVLYAFAPYILFRFIFLSGFVGLQSPISLLPENGLTIFLNSSWAFQALSFFIETLIMSMSVLGRQRFLQKELSKSLQEKKNLVEKQNIILENKVDERTKQLSEEQKVVNESIDYASILQKGQLPKEQQFKNRFNSISVLWEPRDKIGGDVWWVSKENNLSNYSLAVVDCTGHGVPGAMLSLLVTTSLDRIYSENSSISPDKTILLLDDMIRLGLNQDSKEAKSNDGCDLAIIQVDSEKQKIFYSAARLNLYQLSKSNNLLIKHDSDRIGVGYKEKIEYEPKLNEIQYEAGDKFIIFTDGFSDQVGISNGKKMSYGYKRAEDIMRKNINLTPNELTKKLKEDFIKWQGNEIRRDDFTLVTFNF